MDSLSPGPMLDAMIARLLWRAIVFVDVSNDIGFMIDEKRKMHRLPQFSTMIDASAKLAQMMRALGHQECVRCDPDTGRYLACFIGENDEEESLSFSEASTKPMAMCLAALAALGAHQQP